MAGTNETTEEKAQQAVREVIARITETALHSGYKLSEELENAMPRKYLPGFIDAIEHNANFWEKFRIKVLRMAGYAAAFACYFAERQPSFFASAGEEYPLVVDVREWLMGMGVVQSACMAGRDAGLGKPCNLKNFPIEDAIKHETVKVLTSVVTSLMTDAPAPSAA